MIRTAGAAQAAPKLFVDTVIIYAELSQTISVKRAKTICGGK